MGIETNVKESDNATKFPKLMENKRTGMVVLAIGPNICTVLHVGHDECSYIGEYLYNDWRMSEFVNFDGTLELKND